MKNHYLFPVSILVILFLFGLSSLQSQPPRYITADAPSNVFSGERARNLLQQLIPDNLPHPIGSLENKKVKRRILDWLAAHNIEAVVDARWGCYPERGRCAWTENIVATIPGEIGEPYIAMMAHYDSVGASPGAGDDMIGVSIIMEIARMIKTQSSQQRSVMLVITDGEEDALLGAEAFFTQNPIAKKIAVVLNMEGTGSKGKSLLFRTANGNAAIVNAYATRANNPQGSAFAGELFRLLPNDTDLSVVIRRGIMSAEFGFSDGGNHHYHTPLDNTVNLDPMTIQNHGENLFALVTGLIEQNPSDFVNEDVVYENIYGNFLVWSQLFNLVFLVASAALLFYTVSKIENKTQLIYPGLLTLVIFVSIILAFLGTLVSLHFIRGETPFWPEYDLPYRILAFGVPILIGLIYAIWANKRWELTQFILGVSLFWWFVSALLTYVAPNAAYLTLLPVLTAALLLSIHTRIESKTKQWVHLIIFIALVPMTIPKILQFYNWQTYWLIFFTVPFFTLLVSFAAPFARGKFVFPTLVSMFLIIIGAAISSLLLPSYSEAKPHWMNYHLIQNADNLESWLKYDGMNRPPEYIMNVRSFSEEGAIFPWGEKIIDDLSSIETQKISVSTEIVSRNQPNVKGRTVEVDLTSNQNPIFMGLVIPSQSGLESFELAGVIYPVTPAWWADWQDNYVLEFRGVQNKSVAVKLNFSENQLTKAYLYELYPRLPSGYEAELEARSILSVPKHDGDRHMLFRQVEF